jgi:hypothetical protein
MTKNSDLGFLQRTDKAWRYLFMLATALLSPVVTQLLIGFNMHILAVLLLLVGVLVLPFVIEIWGIMSESVKLRFYSWTMVILCMIATGTIYLYGGILRVYLRPLLVPRSMSLGNFILLSSVIDGLITLEGMRQSIRRLIRHFLTNLKGKSYRADVPVFHDGMGWNFILIYVFYLCVEFSAVWFLLH